jgi:hypothetical protein
MAETFDGYLNDINEFHIRTSTSSNASKRPDRARWRKARSEPEPERAPIELAASPKCYTVDGSRRSFTPDQTLARPGVGVGVGEIPDGHRWDLSPKIRFAPDPPVEEMDSNLRSPPR